MKKTMSKSNL